MHGNPLDLVYFRLIVFFENDFSDLNLTMYRLDQGQSYIPDKQTSLEDRYYNNQSFQVCYFN